MTFLSKPEVAQKLHDWYEAGFIHDNTLTEEQAQLIWAAIGYLQPDPTAES